jgi:anti-sigma-K factor RskA
VTDGALSPPATEPTVAEPPADDLGGQPGWREVALIAVAIVAIVLAIAAVSFAVPGVADAFARLPLLIIVLIGGTLAVVWRILRAPTAPR